MVESNDPKQMCLDLSNAALALFDELEKSGDAAPMEQVPAFEKLMTVFRTYDNLRSYYTSRSTQRLIALGVPPAGYVLNTRKPHGR